MAERLQKFLARAGLGSRRQIEDWVRQGRITVNGVAAQLGAQVGAADNIQIDGKRVSVRADRQRRRVLAYYKPVGEMTTRSDPEGRPTIFERLPPLRDGRWIAVGRLDLTTQGLLLVTNDGELANRLAHPSFGVAKTYLATLAGPLPRTVGRELLAGVELEDGLARADSFRVVQSLPGQVLVEVVLHEGRNHIVRRMLDAVGHPVLGLVRTRVGPIVLGQQRPGTVRVLSGAEARALYTEVGL